MTMIFPGMDPYLETRLVWSGFHNVLVVYVRYQRDFDYLVTVNRATNSRRSHETYPCTLRERLPQVRIPLAEGDSDVVLDLQSVVNKTYGAGTYRMRLDYDSPCLPPLGPADQEWASALIKTAT